MRPQISAEGDPKWELFTFSFSETLRAPLPQASRSSQMVQNRDIVQSEILLEGGNRCNAARVKRRSGPHTTLKARSRRHAAKSRALALRRAPAWPVVRAKSELRADWANVSRNAGNACVDACDSHRGNDVCVRAAGGSIARCVRVHHDGNVRLQRMLRPTVQRCERGSRALQPEWLVGL